MFIFINENDNIIKFQTYFRHKKFGSGSIFCVFASVTSILIGKVDEYRKKKKNAYENFGLGVQGP